MKTFTQAIAAIGILLAAMNAAVAGPEGFYFVEGNFVDGTPYTGTVSVERTDETYTATWKLSDGIYWGAGLGAAPTNEAAIIGPASKDDDVLTFGYWGGDEDDVGVAFYMKQPDGTWDGVWTEYGSRKVSREVWTPLPPVVDQKPLEY